LRHELGKNNESFSLCHNIRIIPMQHIAHIKTNECLHSPRLSAIICLGFSGRALECNQIISCISYSCIVCGRARDCTPLAKRYRRHLPLLFLHVSSACTPARAIYGPSLSFAMCARGVMAKPVCEVRKFMSLGAHASYLKYEFNFPFTAPLVSDGIV
jgi:hypothetical protein